MTPEDRQALRVTVDAARRELVDLPGDKRNQWREQARRKRERIKRGEIVATTHSRSGYQNGCRCDICRAAHCAYTKARYWKKKEAKPAT